MPFTPHPPSGEPRQAGASAAFARVYWILLGNFFVGLAAVRISLGSDALTAADVAYWAAVAALIAVRYVDVERLGGTTADGAPATRAHWRRYAVRVLAASSLLWLIARGVARVLRS